MKNLLILFIAGLLAVYMIGCGADDENYNDIRIDYPISATPPSGSEITTDTIIYFIFTYAPENVTVSAGVATVEGKTVKISGPFRPGPLTLIITDGYETWTLYYTVLAPDTEAPKVTGGTIIDGARDVDHNAINTEAKIEFTFNEEVAGDVALQTEDGDDVGWFDKIEGNQAILELVKGKELNCGTTYMIVGKVSDPAGNETDFEIAFDTEPCP